MPLARSLCMLALVGLLSACASSSPPPRKGDITSLTDAQCLGLADGLKTLRKGDPLPRAVQVLGEPHRSYRVIAPFGGTYDILEYDMGQTPCAKLVLASPKKFRVVFDSHGALVNSGVKAFNVMQRATMVRLQGVPVSMDAYNEN